MQQRERRRLEPSGLERLQRAIDADIAAGRCDGVSLCVDLDGESVVDIRAGYAERAAGRPLRDDDVFVTLSAGKQFANVAVLSAIESGALSFFTQVGEVLPCFSGSAWRGMTIAQLLCHTSGVLAGTPAVPVDVLVDTARLAAFAAARGPQYAPGSRVSQSTVVAHAVLGEILRVVDGGTRDISAILRETLFDPLGMRDTSLGRREDLLPRLCPVVARYDEPGLFDPRALEGFNALVTAPGACLPGGGYLTTSHDLRRFVRMLACGGSLDGKRILSPAMLELCARNQTGALSDDLFDAVLPLRDWRAWPASMGLGFIVRGEALTPGPLPNLGSAKTLGGWGAGSTAFWADPVHGVSFSLLSTGLMEDTRHLQRVQRLSDIVLASLSN